MAMRSSSISVPCVRARSETRSRAQIRTLKIAMPCVSIPASQTFASCNVQHAPIREHAATNAHLPIPISVTVHPHHPIEVQHPSAPNFPPECLVSSCNCKVLHTVAHYGKFVQLSALSSPMLHLLYFPSPRLKNTSTNTPNSLAPDRQATGQSFITVNYLSNGYLAGSRHLTLYWRMLAKVCQTCSYFSAPDFICAWMPVRVAAA